LDFSFVFELILYPFAFILLRGARLLPSSRFQL
jgi:hypothetical protein